MPLVRVKQKFQVTLPVEVRGALHIEEGDLLEALVQDDSVVLTPKAVVDKKSLDAYLDERLEELHAGKTVGPFTSTEEYECKADFMRIDFLKSADNEYRSLSPELQKRTKKQLSLLVTNLHHRPLRRA